MSHHLTKYFIPVILQTRRFENPCPWAGGWGDHSSQRVVVHCITTLSTICKRFWTAVLKLIDHLNILSSPEYLTSMLCLYLHRNTDATCVFECVVVKESIRKVFSETTSLSVLPDLVTPPRVPKTKRTPLNELPAAGFKFEVQKLEERNIIYSFKQPDTKANESIRDKLTLRYPGREANDAGSLSR